jgi:hypothetical protein
MVTWHPSAKSHDGGMVHQIIDADKEWSGGDDLLNTLCEITKANDEDLLEALMSMHDKETVALRKTLQRVFATLDAVQSELDAMDNESLHLD